MNQVKDRNEGEQARDNLRGEHDDRVAKRPRAQPQAGGRRFGCWIVIWQLTES
jgi:hypothetical protein